VAQVVAGMPPGGKERILVHLATFFAAQGIESPVICLTGMGTFGEALAAGGLPVVALNSRRRWDLAMVWRLARLLRRLRPDLINVHDRSSLPYAFLANRLSVKRPLVLSSYGLLFDDCYSPSWRERLALRDVAAVTAVSKSAADEYAQALQWCGEITITGNGVPLSADGADLRHRQRLALGLAPKVFAFVAVGGIAPEKGYEDLLEAASLLRARGMATDWVVLIAGRCRDETYWQLLARRLKALNLAEKVRFLGYTDDVRALYAAADAFVLPSRKEGLPTVVLEAMASGLAVIATQVGGVPDVVTHGQDGLLVSPRSPEGLCGAMAEVAADPSLCTRLGRSARSRVEREYSVEQMGKSYLGVYERAIVPRRR
jgi:glycosyltransferase involved in cell wall biosynthesis